VLATIDDLHIRTIRELSTPAAVTREYPRPDAVTRTVIDARDALRRILHREDDRLAVIIGPCSIHDPRAALD